MWDNWEVLREALEEERQNTLNFIAEGNAQDYAAYKYKCGLLHGLEKAIALMKDKQRKLEDAAFGDS